MSDASQNTSTARIKLHSTPIYGLEVLRAAELMAGRETDLMAGLSLADGISLEKVEILADGARTVVPEPSQFIPEYPGTCSVIFSVKNQDKIHEVAVDGLLIHAFAYSPVPVNSLQPQDIIPIV